MKTLKWYFRQGSRQYVQHRRNVPSLENYLPGCDAAYYRRYITAFCKKVLTLSSGQKIEVLVYSEMLAGLNSCIYPRRKQSVRLVPLSTQYLISYPISFSWRSPSQSRSQNCEKRLLASSCPSVRMKQLDSHWTDFNEV